MNVYACHYRGIAGYCCRRHKSKWLFVPDLGAFSSEIHRHVHLEELVFANPLAHAFEASLQQHPGILRSVLKGLKELLLPAKNHSTIGGLLFAPMVWYRPLVKKLDSSRMPCLPTHILAGHEKEKTLPVCGCCCIYCHILPVWPATVPQPRIHQVPAGR